MLLSSRTYRIYLYRIYFLKDFNILFEYKFSSTLIFDMIDLY